MRSTAEIRRHWARVRDLGCIVTGRPEPTIHHCKGGSMSGLAQKGMGQKTSHWLVIPLDWELHTGKLGIDAGQPWLTTEDWEREFGQQAELLDQVSRLVGVNVWRQAGIDRHVEGISNGDDT